MTSYRFAGFYVNYVLGWIAFCLLAVLILVRDRRSLVQEGGRYWEFLSVPWKLVLFVPALIFVTFAGRYTDDGTWDAVTGFGMATLTFFTAPWAIGLFYQILVGLRPKRYFLVAAALLLFSSSWYYDGYQLWRTGAYTTRWSSNLALSPIIYLAAGFLWNLESRSESRFGFSFTRPDWPRRPVDTRFRPLIIVSLPFILVAAFVLLAFVGWRFA